MVRTIITNGKVIINKKKMISNEAILIEDGIIKAIGDKENLPKADHIIDAEGCYICPGMLDTHTHGIGGYDFNKCDVSDLETIMKMERAEGVTGFLASLVVENHDTTLALLKKLDYVVSSSFLGIHLEGPFLNKEQKAVMKEEYLRSPDKKEFQEFIKVSSHICSMSIAPELEKAIEVIKSGTKQGIVMNIGHSNATAQQVLEAEKAGAKGITHLYNAMSQHEHRNPGVVSGAFISNLMCELIVDGFHIHPDVVNGTYRSIGSDRIVLITDANPYKGLDDGEYVFSGKNIVIDQGKATVKETGRIAGSTLSMRKAVENFCTYTGCTLEEAFRMASYNPGQMYSWKKGSIEVGYDADLLLMDDEFQIHKVWTKEDFI